MESDFESYDYCDDWLWELDETPIPPLCVDVVLRDGCRHHVQCVMAKDEKTKSMAISVYDMRALSDEDIKELRRNLNEGEFEMESGNASDYHPKLDRANLRIHLEDVWYCVEWHNRMWPIQEREEMGFHPRK